MSSHVAPSDNAPLDPDDELLVAYLDGELDAQAENALMSRLIEEQELNRRLQRLQEGWEWLDKLPDVTPSEKLVETTLELVVADIVKAKPKTSSPWVRYRTQLIVAAAALIGIVASWITVGTIKANAYRQQLSDLALAENLDAYFLGSDMTFMRQLAADQSWTQMINASREVGDIPPVTPMIIADSPLEQRASVLAKLPLEDRVGLASRWGRFSRLDEVNVQRIRKTAAAVAAQPDADLLLQTMQVYAAWRETLPTELRDGIESSDPIKKREALNKAIEISQASIVKRSRDQLDDETVERIYFVLRQILQQRIDAGDQATINHLENTRKFVGERDPEPIAIFGLVYSGTQRFGRRPGPGPRPPSRERPPALRDEELEMIRLILPTTALETLYVITESGEIDDTLLFRNLTLRNWAEEAARRKMPKWGPEKISALDSYNELSEAERARIDFLPPKEIINRISQPSRFP